MLQFFLSIHNVYLKVYIYITFLSQHKDVKIFWQDARKIVPSVSMLSWADSAAAVNTRLSSETQPVKITLNNVIYLISLLIRWRMTVIVCVQSESFWPHLKLTGKNTKIWPQIDIKTCTAEGCPTLRSLVHTQTHTACHYFN